ncbi:MAG: putative S-layer protein [Nanoarchaeota archaeon]|nr:putative S-layer protein [Nanoarchaeota archaeon]
MKKEITLIFGIFALMLMVSTVSAAITLPTDAITLNQFGDVVSFTISNSVASPVTVSLSSQTISDGKGHTATVTFSPTGSVIVPASSSVPINASITIPVDSAFVFGKTFSTNYVISEVGNATNNDNLTLNFMNSPNQDKNLGDNLDVSIDTLNVENGFGEDTSWFPLDEIRAKVDVTNDGADKIKSIVLNYGLYDIDAGKWIIKEKESSFSLNDGDDKSLTVDFILDSLSKFDADNSNYRFYAWVTGEDEEFSSNKTSDIDSESIDVQFENDFVILSNIQVPELVNCGSQIEITADISNVGSDNQNNVYVEIINSQLGLDETVQIGDIDSLDSTTMDFTFNVPQDAQEGSYPITFLVYDENDDLYTNGFNDDESKFNVPLKIQGGACVFDAKLITSADLTSGGKAGQEMAVKVTVTNTDTVSRTFTVSSSGYDAWAKLVKFSPDTLVLGAGDSAEVELTFLVNSDASGKKTFNLDLTDKDSKVIPQPVEVTVEKPGFSLFPGTGSVIGNSNWYVWAIGALNIVLVLIIILVAVRLVKK